MSVRLQYNLEHINSRYREDFLQAVLEKVLLVVTRDAALLLVYLSTLLSPFIQSSDLIYSSLRLSRLG